jgi:hypothetical protein
MSCREAALPKGEVRIDPVVRYAFRVNQPARVHDCPINVGALGEEFFYAGHISIERSSDDVAQKRQNDLAGTKPLTLGPGTIRSELTTTRRRQ